MWTTLNLVPDIAKLRAVDVSALARVPRRKLSLSRRLQLFKLNIQSDSTGYSVVPPAKQRWWLDLLRMDEQGTSIAAVDEDSADTIPAVPGDGPGDERGQPPNEEGAQLESESHEEMKARVLMGGGGTSKKRKARTPEELKAQILSRTGRVIDIDPDTKSAILDTFLSTYDVHVDHRRVEAAAPQQADSPQAVADAHGVALGGVLALWQSWKQSKLVKKLTGDTLRRKSARSAPPETWLSQFPSEEEASRALPRLLGPLSDDLSDEDKRNMLQSFSDAQTRGKLSCPSGSFDYLPESLPALLEELTQAGSAIFSTTWAAVVRGLIEFQVKLAREEVSGGDCDAGGRPAGPAEVRSGPVGGPSSLCM